jgi:predicted amidohydrolase
MSTAGNIFVGLAQLECAPLDPAENAKRTTESITTAAEGGAEVIVLPELAASGYVIDADKLRRVAESFDSPGLVLSAWRHAAAANGVRVIGGFCELAEGQLYNSVAIIDRAGRLVGTYRKLHLFGAAERNVFAPGNAGLPVFELDGLRLGVLVCYDLRFPESMRILAMAGADLIVVPTAWVSGFDAELPDSTRSRIGQVDGVLVQANLNASFVACADQVGGTAEHVFLGRSLVADPFGRPIIGPLDAQRPAVKVVELSLSALKDSRDRGNGIRPLLDRRTDVYDELLGYNEQVREKASA